MIRFLMCLAIVSPLAISPSILNVLNLGYVTGNPLLGIHMSTYAALLAAGALFGTALATRTAGRLIYPPSALYLAGVCVVLMVILVLNGETGFRLAMIIVTFLTPAIMLFIIRNRVPGVFEFASLFVTGFLVLNSTLGFYEYLTKDRLLPYMPGLEAITYDPRPTALLAHPLVNALVTGVYLLSLLIVAVRRGATPLRLAAILFFTASMFSFGGRTALVAVFLVFALYAVFQVAMVLLTRGREGKSAVRTALIVAGLAVALPVFLTTPIASTMLDRFQNSRASDETRSAAITMLQTLRGDEYLFGVEDSTRIQLQASLGSNNGVELSWVSLIMYFGTPATIALLTGMFALIWGASQRDRDQLFVGLFFVITTFGALSIGSRSLSITQLIVVMSFGPIASARRKLSRASGSQGSRAVRSAGGQSARPTEAN